MNAKVVPISKEVTADGRVKAHWLNKHWKYYDANSHMVDDNPFPVRQRQRRIDAGWIKETDDA